MVRTGATFADAAAEYLRYIGEDRVRKASTVEDYRSIIRVHLLPAFGDAALESITVSDVEAFQARLAKRVHNGRPITPRTRNKILNVLHGVFQHAKKVWALPLNPAAQLERHPSRSSGDIEVYAPEEVWALVREAADKRDASVYVTAAFTGLRMCELRALRWRDVDFRRSVIRVRASYAEGELSVPKSGKVRSVPMVPEVARQLARLAERANGPATTIWCWPSYTASGLTTTSCAADTTRRSGRPACGGCGFTTSVTRSACDHTGGHRRGPSLDGPCRHPDDDALPHYRDRDRGRAAERLADAFAFSRRPPVPRRHGRLMPLPESDRPLPRAADAFVDDEKWLGYVLSDRGHRGHWSRAFGEVDPDALWAMIAHAVLVADVTEMRIVEAGGITCRVPVTITIEGRSRAVRTVWHYARAGAAPRLVTAFPTT